MQMWLHSRKSVEKMSDFYLFFFGGREYDKTKLNVKERRLPGNGQKKEYGQDNSLRVRFFGSLCVTEK